MKPVVIFFGASSLGVTALSTLRRRVRIVAFADNDPAKQGTRFHGVPVIAPASIPGRAFDGVVITSLYSQQICTQLAGLGVPAEVIHVYGSHSSGQRPAFPWDAVLALGLTITLVGAAAAGLVVRLCVE
ncbi:MAG: hypothetical protein Q7V01_06050 [Vicinamibacterales bacterium]|nr:hypothetical protein [Vicinamibacterales bacterium]